MTRHIESQSDTASYIHQDPVVDGALDWYLRLEDAPEDAELRAGFQAWLSESPAHGQAFDRIAGVSSLAETAFANRPLPQTGAERPAAHALRAGGRRPWRFLAAAATAAVLIAAIGLYPQLMLQLRADYVTGTGDQQDVTLPDGSVMSLNTASAVALDFTHGRRSVALLQGEAFFEVKPDPAHPFTVAGRFSEVTVKGTGFSVRSDTQEDRVVLDHGAVEIIHLPDRQESAFLDPGETISANAASLSPVSAIDTETSLAWRKGRIIFDHWSLSQVIAEIGRYYPRPVFIASSRLAKIKVSGNYRLADPEGTIRSLASAAGADLTALPGGILILR